MGKSQPRSKSSGDCPDLLIVTKPVVAAVCRLADATLMDTRGINGVGPVGCMHVSDAAQYTTSWFSLPS